MFAVTMALALALAVSDPVDNSPRGLFSACVKGSMDKAGAAKIPPEGFAAFARQSCSGEMVRFRADIIAYDMKAGWTRAKAEPDADSQIDDSLADWTDRYRDKGSLTGR